MATDRMKMIYLNRNGQHAGPYSEEELRRQISAGQILSTDLAWQHDAGGWVPLGRLLGPPFDGTPQPRGVAENPPLDLARIAGTSWNAFTTHFGLLIAVAMIGAAPSLLVDLAGLDAKELFSARGLVQHLFEQCADAVAEAFKGIGIYVVYQCLHGRRFSYAQAVSEGLSRYGTLLLLTLVINLVFYAGTLALFVPLILLSAIYFVCDPICMVEGAGVGASMSKSKELTKGYRGKLALVMIVQLLVLLPAIFLLDGNPVLKFALNVLADAYLSSFTTTAYVELVRLRRTAAGNGPPQWHF